MAKRKQAETEEEVLHLQVDEELNRVIDDLTLFDDDLMSRVFDGNIEATELLLRIILERDDISVVSVKGQEEMKSPYPRGESSLEDTARNALFQIEEKKYDTDLIQKGIPAEKILKYGFAFEGETCLIKKADGSI